MNIVVIIPTYNEHDNIDRLVNALETEFKHISNHTLSVLFVDDSSPDGTAELIKKHQQKHPWIHLLLRKQKQGLGAAYAAGIQHAIETLKADAFIESDADFQHNPADIKRLIKEFDNGYDYVIGSRYIKGGSIPHEWEFSRKFLSVVGNLVARVLLMLPNIHDVTGGFKLTRVKSYGEHLRLDHLISKSFAYKIQLLFEMVQRGAKVKEIPVDFLTREKGESKIIKNEIGETLRVIFTLQYRNPKIRQFIKFGIVGFTGYIIQAITLEILSRFLGADKNNQVCTLTQQLTNPKEAIIWGGSAEMAIISNFTFNNLWTFKSNKISGITRTLNKFFQFNLTSVGAIIIQIIAGSIGTGIFGCQYRQLLLPFIIALLIIPYNYLMYTKIIWKK